MYFSSSRVLATWENRAVMLLRIINRLSHDVTGTMVDAPIDFQSRAVAQAIGTKARISGMPRAVNVSIPPCQTIYVRQ